MKEDDFKTNLNNNNNNQESISDILSNKQMIGGCCVCADDSGYCDNPLVYCDGNNCNVAVHQACYGIVTVPEGPWFCRKCELIDKEKDISCCLCPSKEGAMKKTDSNGWAHVICALYIPEITFINVRTMEPIVTNNIRTERLNKKCYICEQNNRHDICEKGVCVGCSKTGCKLWFHVTCAQKNGLLCEDHSLPGNNVKYCIYCKTHQAKLNNDQIKLIPAFRLTDTPKQVKKINSTNHKKTKSNDKQGILLNKHEKYGKKLQIKKEKINKIGDLNSNKSLKLESNSNITKTNELNNENDKQESLKSPKELIKDEKSTDNQVESKQTINNILTSKDKSTAMTLAQLSTLKTEEEEVKRMDTSLKIDIDTYESKKVKKSKKINAMSPNISTLLSMQSSNIPSTNKPTTTSTKRKSIDQEEKKKDKLQVSPNAKRRRQLNEDISLDIFGNHLNLNATIPLKLKETLEKEKLQQTETVKSLNTIQNQPENHSQLNKLLSKTTLIGPTLPSISATYSVLKNEDDETVKTQSNIIPETLEDLLLKKWSMDSEFFMDQSQNFDVTSLLNGLYQLKKENKDLEAKIIDLNKKRDQLVIINAKLAVPLEYHSNILNIETDAKLQSSTNQQNVNHTNANNNSSSNTTPVLSTSFNSNLSQIPSTNSQPIVSSANKQITTPNLNLTTEDLNLLKTSTNPKIQQENYSKQIKNLKQPSTVPNKKQSTDFSISNIQTEQSTIQTSNDIQKLMYHQSYQQQLQPIHLPNKLNQLENEKCQATKQYASYLQHIQNQQSTAIIQPSQHQEETKRFEKLNQLLSHNSNPIGQPSNSVNIPTLTSSNQNELHSSNSKPSAYVAPVMIKQQQQQQQSSNAQMPYFYQQTSNTRGLNHLESNQQSTHKMLPPNFIPPSSLPQSTTKSLPPPSTATSTSTNDVYYPLQNILLTPSLTLNYGWQNLLQHVDSSNPSSMLSIIPHFSNLDLLNLATQSNNQTSNTNVSSSTSSSQVTTSNQQQQQQPPQQQASLQASNST